MNTVSSVHHLPSSEPLAGKRVVFVCAGEPWSIGKDVGAPSFYETLKGYCEAGAEVHFLTHHKSGVNNDAHAHAVDVELPGLVTHRFHLPKSAARYLSRVESKLVRLTLFPRAAAVQLSKLIDELNPDLIYAYENSAVLAVHRLRKSRALSIPVINRFQGTILGARYADFLHAVRKLESTLALRVRADAYIMTDDGTLGDRAIRHWNSDVDDTNLLFLRNGIDLDIGNLKVDREAKLRGLGLDPGATYLLTVCRLAAWKRVDRAIRIMAALHKRYPLLRLLVCGEGPVRPQLEQLATETGVRDHVHFLGAQPRASVAELMHASDIFLSLYDVSNCGNPLFEAQLASKPLVTLDNGATSTVITDGVNGRLISPNAERELPDVVADLLDNGEKRQALAAGARAWAARELYTWEERLRREIVWLRERLPSLR